MIATLRDWFDDRTGYRKIVEALLIEHIPGGARWRYVWGSCLAFVFAIQVVTGVLLMTAYSAGDSTSWASVYWIQYHMEFGWLIRGLHHFGSQTMIVLLAVHMLQVVIAGAHLPPREVNWWLGLALLGAVLGLGLTGYLLPWDQKGYWATQVATNIAGNLPLFGTWLQKIIVGGPEYGHHTLTRFFTLHVGVLPPLIVVLLVAHIWVFRRHGVTTPRNSRGEGLFWPDQAFRDLVACLAVFAVMVSLVVFGGHGHKLDSKNVADGPREIIAPATNASHSPASAQPVAPSVWKRIALAGHYYGCGANLDAPSDPAAPYPARPEWYFLPLFQLLKYFHGDMEIVGTVVIPNGIGLVLALLPLLGFGRMRAFGHIVGVAVVGGLIGGAAYLTYLAIDEDQAEPTLVAMSDDEYEQLANDHTWRTPRNQKARHFQIARRHASERAKRAIELADAGIPAEGPKELLRRDPMTNGPVVFVKNCASCHRYPSLDTAGHALPGGDKASNLEGFGTEDWLRRLLRDPGHADFFGNTKLTGMAEWAQENLKNLSAEKEAELEALIKWLALHPTDRSPQVKSDAFQRGLRAFREGFECIQCHRYEGKGLDTAPDLTGYASADWIRGMILAPDHVSRYGKKNAMPVFRDLDGADKLIVEQENARRKPGLVHLSDLDREMVVRWLVGDNRLVVGSPNSAASETTTSGAEP